VSSNGISDSDDVIVTVNPLPAANAGADIEICQDESVTLTAANGGNTYVWNTGQTSRSITVSPENTTTYTVTVTQNGCSASDDVTVTVKPRPAINAGSDVEINLGESTTLTASGDGTFLWSTGEETQSLTVSPTETTTYTVTATLNGCTNSDSIRVTVVEPGDVIANAGEDVTICENETVTLTASGGTNYLWSNGETTQSIEVSPNVTTIYIVTVSTNGISDSDDVIVNVNLLPDVDAGDDVTIESGQSVTLFATGGNSYLWSNGQTTQSISVSPIESKVYTVEAFKNGCSKTDDIRVTVVEQVDASAGEDDEICLGESTTLTASGGEFFTWSTGEETSSITVSPSRTTIYSVSVSNGISTQNAVVTVTVNNCLLNNPSQDFEFDFSVYPNPTDGQINIKLTGFQNISMIYVSDIYGKLILSESFEPKPGTVFNKQYNFSSFSKGVYFLTIQQNEGPAITKKIILK
jgi:hypothetical protein